MGTILFSALLRFVVDLLNVAKTNIHHFICSVSCLFGTLEPRIVHEFEDKVTDSDENASEVSESASQTALHNKKVCSRSFPPAIARVSLSIVLSLLSCNVLQKLLTRRRGSQQNLTVTINKNLGESSYNSSGDETEDGATLSSPCSFCPLTEGTTSAGEWVGVTTNSEECSYSSELEGSDGQFAVTSDISEHPFAWEMEMVRILFTFIHVSRNVVHNYIC